MTKTEFVLCLLLMVAAATIGIQYGIYSAGKEATYRKGVMFGHRCVNASVADNDGRLFAAESFRLQAKAFQDYGWQCNPGESLLLQDR